MTRTSRRVRFVPTVDEFEPRCLPAVDPILAWNAVLLQANAVDHSDGSPEQGGPELTARAMAIVSAAMYDAFNSVHPIGEAYLTSVPNVKNADADAAVAQAAHDTLVALYPSQANTFDDALAQTLANVPDGPGEKRGCDVGRIVAAAVLQARAGDMADTMQDPPYVFNGQLGFHNVDPLNPGQGFYAPDYQSVTPFALPSADTFQARRLDDGTPAGRLAFLQSPEYTAAYNEVLNLGGDGVTTPTSRTPEQTIIGRFWGYDGAPGVGTPPRLYNQIARVIAQQEGNTVAENARLFALINIAMADAGLSAWNTKYDDQFWRPILGIRNGDADGNGATDGDPNWKPLGAAVSNGTAGQINFTPPFPAYTSGHATFGAAAFQTLTRFYGTDHITFTVVSDEFNGITHDAGSLTPRPFLPRTFHSFSEASFENAQSRIYLGIHWAFDRDEGIRCGATIADYVFGNILKPSGANVLVVNATAGNDIIQIFHDAVVVNGVRTPFLGIDAILVFAGAGNDTIIVANNLQVPTMVHGGPGDDTLIGRSRYVHFAQGGLGGLENDSVRLHNTALERGSPCDFFSALDELRARSLLRD